MASVCRRHDLGRAATHPTRLSLPCLSDTGKFCIRKTLASEVLFSFECSHVSNMHIVPKVVVLEDVTLNQTSNFGKCM